MRSKQVCYLCAVQPPNVAIEDAKISLYGDQQALTTCFIAERLVAGAVLAEASVGVAVVGVDGAAELLAAELGHVAPNPAHPQEVALATDHYRTKSVRFPTVVLEPSLVILSLSICDTKFIMVVMS